MKPELTLTGPLIFPKNHDYITGFCLQRADSINHLRALLGAQLFPGELPLSKIPGHHPKFQIPSQWGNSEVNRSHSQSGWGASGYDSGNLGTVLIHLCKGCSGASRGDEQEVGRKKWINCHPRWWTCERYGESERRRPEGAQDSGHRASFSSLGTKFHCLLQSLEEGKKKIKNELWIISLQTRTGQPRFLQLYMETLLGSSKYLKQDSSVLWRMNHDLNNTFWVQNSFGGGGNKKTSYANVGIPSGRKAMRNDRHFYFLEKPSARGGDAPGWSTCPAWTRPCLHAQYIKTPHLLW